jgi:hypothetical protein
MVKRQFDKGKGDGLLANVARREALFSFGPNSRHLVQERLILRQRHRSAIYVLHSDFSAPFLVHTAQAENEGDDKED